MGSYVNVFLKTEITLIPRLLDKFIGKYYNNTLCNGVTWLFLIWYILHMIFDVLLNALLRRMKYKEYLRIRLLRSLWYLGFYTTACIYCTATLIRNDLLIINTNNSFDNVNMPGHLMLGFIVLSTFYLHCALWERLKYSNRLVATSYLCLFFLLFFSYFLRFVESSFRLTIIICTTQVTVELARCITILLKRDTFRGKLITRIFFASSIVVFVINNIIVVPLLFGYPLAKGFSPSVSILLSCLIIWLLVETFSSVPLKAISHWLNHDPDGADKIDCGREIIECSLFPPRNDATYTLIQLRKDMKLREAKTMSLRKPKNKNVVYQTLKCMVAIKRKLNQKRRGMANVDVDDNEITMDNDNTGNNTNSMVYNEEANINSEETVGGKLQFSINSQNERNYKHKND